MDADHRQICKFDSDEDPRYQQVADSIIALMNDAVTTSRNRASELNSQQSGNNSRTKGSKNSTNQTGKENRSNVQGVGNQTNQIGRGNNSEVDGEENATLQIEMGDLNALKVAEMFLLGKAQSGGITLSPWRGP